MPKLKPATFLDDLFAGEFIFEVVLAIGVVITSTIQGLRFTYEVPPKPELAALSIVTGGVMAAFLIARGVSRNRKARRDGNPQSLTALLFCLHEILLEL